MQVYYMMKDKTKEILMRARKGGSDPNNKSEYARLI